MQFVAPVPFKEAVQKLGAKSPIGAALSSRQWSAVPVGLREAAIWSANVESVRVVQDMRDFLTDFQTSAKAPVLKEDGTPKLDKNGQPMTALKVGSRAKFIELVRRKAIAEGLGPIDPDDVGTIKDIRSEKRLGLIFDVQTKSATAYGNRQQGLDPDVLDEFPGQRFIREREVKSERDAHRPYEGAVALKTNISFWLRINIDFGVPWAPWGWGCGHDVEDVDRDETDALGLTQPGQPIPGAPAPGEDKEPFNQHLKSSVKNLDPDLVKFLRQKLGNQVEIENGEARWRSSASKKAADVSTLPTPAPAPTSKPEANWVQNMDSLAARYDAAPVIAKATMREEARELISVPAAARAGINVDGPNSTAGRTVKKINSIANETIISRFVRPELTKATTVRLHQTKDDRAFYKPTQSGVYLNVDSDISTAAHEMMHAIEIQNPSVLEAAARFLFARRRDNGAEKPQELRKLTCHPCYRSYEIAIEDDWKARGGTVYAGKVYSKTSALAQTPGDLLATEVLTIGIERLYADPIEFFKNDPDWFYFIVETIGIGTKL